MKLFNWQWKVKNITIAILLLINTCLLVSLACSENKEQQEIINFINDSNNSAIMERAADVYDDWSTIWPKAQTYTRSQLIYEIGLLEQRAALSYKEVSELIPPKCLRDFWSKQIEASRLLFQTISLTYKIKDDQNISQEQINELIFEANALKIEALREFEDICEKYNIEISW